MKFSQKVVCAVLKNGNAPPIVHIRENSQQWKQAENDETVGPDMNKRTKRNFTLIELLVVMLLMGVLMTLMLPAFKRMISGNQVDQMASNLKLALEQAQSHAITARRYVAVILPSGWTGQEAQYNLGGSRMAYVKKDSTGTSWQFIRWVPDYEWRIPVPGAHLLAVADEATKNDYGNFVEGQGLDLGNSPYPITHRLITAGGTNPLLHTITNYQDSASDTRTYCAVIFSPYGGIRHDENLYLAIAEAIPNGNNFVFPSRDTTGPTNFLVLEINRFTGRVNYYKP